MGQCWAKRKKNSEESHAERYKPTNSESQQPIVNGGQNIEARLSASNSSLLERKGTQHISDRERGEEHVLEEHPADNPNLQPLFDESSTKKLMRRVSQYDNRMLESSPLQSNKYNSCSTLMVNETVSQPNMKNTIKAVALAIYYLIKNPRPKSHYSSHDDIELDLELQRNLEIFDEGRHPLTGSVTDDYSIKHPEHRHVYRFIRTLFSQAQLNAECSIVTLVYLERLLTYAQFELTPTNWKRCTLGAIMLASKVWDDQAVWNIDFCQIFKEVTVEDMNALERQFLQILQFNTNVPPSIYANYYFNLRSLAQKNELSMSLEPLSKEQAVRLEALSNQFKDRLAGSTTNLKRASSLHSMNRSSKVIIS